MFQFPLLNTMLQGSGKGLGADQIQPEGGLMALLQGVDGEMAGFSGELQAMLMQLAPQMLQRLDELLAGGTSLPQAARTLLSEFAAGGDERAFPDLLHKLAQGSDPRSRVAGMEQRPEPLPEGRQQQLPTEPGPLRVEPGPLRVEPGLPRVEPEPLRADPIPRGNAASLPPLAAEAAPNSPTTAATLSTLSTLATGVAAGASGTLPTTAQPSLPPQLASNLLDMGVPQQVGSKTWSEAVAQRVMWMVQGDQQFARLKLNPPNLGPLEVRVSVSQEQTNVAFLAQHAAVREALEAALPRLREMFDQSSLQLVRADVSDPGAQQGGRSGDSAADHTPHHGAGRGVPADDHDVQADQPQVGGGSGLVDLFA